MKLEKIAAELAPVLEAIKKGEAALESAIALETTTVDALGLSKRLPSLPAILWPMALVDDQEWKTGGTLVGATR